MGFADMFGENHYYANETIVEKIWKLTEDIQEKVHQQKNNWWISEWNKK